MEQLRQTIRFLKIKQMPKKTPKKRSIVTKRAPKKRKVAAKIKPQVAETMDEPNHEDMEQQAVVLGEFVPEGPTSSENMQASSQNTFSDPTLARIQEELAQARLEREKLEERHCP